MTTDLPGLFCSPESSSTAMPPPWIFQATIQPPQLQEASSAANESGGWTHPAAPLSPYDTAILVLAILALPAVGERIVGYILYCIISGLLIHIPGTRDYTDELHRLCVELKNLCVNGVGRHAMDEKWNTTKSKILRKKLDDLYLDVDKFFVTKKPQPGSPFTEHLTYRVPIPTFKAYIQLKKRIEAMHREVIREVHEVIGGHSADTPLPDLYPPAPGQGDSVASLSEYYLEQPSQYKPGARETMVAEAPITRAVDRLSRVIYSAPISANASTLPKTHSRNPSIITLPTNPQPRQIPAGLGVNTECLKPLTPPGLPSARSRDEGSSSVKTSPWSSNHDSVVYDVTPTVSYHSTIQSPVVCNIPRVPSSLKRGMPLKYPRSPPPQTTAPSTPVDQSICGRSRREEGIEQSWRKAGEKERHG
ncbi:hypothetical protein C8Q78DRAFT_1056178 [Trametes maxima]|nr:hypothetical protein C8Q78DRAFT_1056178 [Trametes maxima]